MPSWILFETTEAVIEVLWDIALALFIVRLAFAYFLLTFLSNMALSYLAYAQLLPISHLTTPQSEFVLIPFSLALSVCWARFIIVHYEIPRVSSFRLAIGGLALAFMVVAELLTAVVLYREGHGAWIFETDLPAGLAFGALLGAFTLLPIIMMAFESSADEDWETYHGHEKKPIHRAV